MQKKQDAERVTEDQYYVRNTRTGEHLVVFNHEKDIMFGMRLIIKPSKFNRADAEWWGAALIRLKGDHDIEITPVNP